MGQEGFNWQRATGQPVIQVRRNGHVRDSNWEGVRHEQS
jgi:hypothetical protein